ncbi:NAD(P)H-dependent oxidoreductase [Campylobacter sp. US33a]|uniref:NAD(P)H-dependent oxidoreductase n=1 Tax=Campylobacter sp. US33a TaxID=2498120 RepID=UPI001067D1E0|nr:NAD(P)H-dependent oxidoreductase [Campylobacter sp. US33a]MCW1360949.1 NAD(P)H-dependent oxidoreductase [Campylobacter jejuni]TEY01612.1 NAD(P)H-dependent oxidoreductase [Campylobacter sp. US33a]
MDFDTAIKTRHACKIFKDTKINQKDLEVILNAGILSPSSHGFEPWKFLVLSKKEDNILLSQACYNQENVATASHNIILLARSDLKSKDEFAKKQVRRFCKDEEHFKKVLQIYTHKTDKMNDKELFHYAQLQCYLALMQMSLAAMNLGIDSCMIGGYEKEEVEKIFNIKKPFECAVILALGYKKDEPKYKKQRLDFKEVVQYL